MTTPPASPSRRSPLAVLLLLGAIALVAVYFWPRQAAQPDTAAAPIPTTADAARQAPGASSAGALPPGVTSVGGILVDANGQRILNEAGLPITSEPLPQARPIPVRAPPGTIIGYTKDAQGNSKPLRAGDLKQVPNSPGTYVVVDMWADGGPAVVPATVGQHLTPAEVARLRAAEDARDRAASQQH